MLNRIYRFLQSLNQCRWIVMVALIAVVSISLLSLRHFPVDAPDGKFFYNEQHLEQFFCLDAPPTTSEDDLKTCKANCQHFRQFYVVTQLSLDTLLPLSYATLMGILIARYFPMATARRYVILPILVSASDLTENLILVWLAITWKCGTEFPPLFRIAPWVSATKWALAGICLAVIVVGLFQKRRGRGSP